MKNDHKIDKRVYLGSIDQTKAIHKMFLDTNSLLTLDNPDSVVNVACSHCKSVIEVVQAGAEALSRHAHITPLSNYKGKYFLTSSCLYCKVAKGKITVELKNISELVN
jgi:hypothetical protein